MSVERLLKGVEKSMSITIPSFPDGGPIPKKYTCDGEDISPKIIIGGSPKTASSLALIMYDPDAPIGTFYHWGMHSIPTNLEVIPEGVEKIRRCPYGVQVRNDFGKFGYGGPCPPRWHGEHRYFFVILALDKMLELGPSASVRDLINACMGHVIAYGVYMGRYRR